MSVFLMLSALLLVCKAQAECVQGDMRLTEPVETSTTRGTVMEVTFVEYCFVGTWRVICEHPVTWTQSAAVVVCRQLGYSDKGVRYGSGCYGVNIVRTSVQVGQQCTGIEEKISDCGRVIVLPNCLCGNYAWIVCQPECTNNELRLVNGSTNREGRVEVCVDGRWGTVCNNQEGLAGAVCAQLGLPAEGAYAIDTHSPSTPTSPVTSCTIHEGSLSCTQITDASCDHTMDLGVLCQHQTISSPGDDNDCPTVSLPVDFTEQSNTNEGSGAQSSSTVAYETVVSILVVLQVITLTGWIVTCFGKHLMKSIRKRATTEVTTSRNESYNLQTFNNTATPTQATPTEDDYSTVQGPTYDVIDDVVPEYDVIDHNQGKPYTARH